MERWRRLAWETPLFYVWWGLGLVAPWLIGLLILMRWTWPR